MFATLHLVLFAAFWPGPPPEYPGPDSAFEARIDWATEMIDGGHAQGRERHNLLLNRGRWQLEGGNPAAALADAKALLAEPALEPHDRLRAIELAGDATYTIGDFEQSLHWWCQVPGATRDVGGWCGSALAATLNQAAHMRGYCHEQLGRHDMAVAEYLSTLGRISAPNDTTADRLMQLYAGVGALPMLEEIAYATMRREAEDAGVDANQHEWIYRLYVSPFTAAAKIAALQSRGDPSAVIGYLLQDLGGRSRPHIMSFSPWLNEFIAMELSQCPETVSAIAQVLQADEPESGGRQAPIWVPWTLAIIGTPEALALLESQGTRLQASPSLLEAARRHGAGGGREMLRKWIMDEAQSSQTRWTPTAPELPANKLGSGGVSARTNLPMSIDQVPQVSK